MGFTPLIHTALNGNVTLCKALLEHGADRDAKDDNGCAALIWAAFFSHEKVCRLLLEQGADTGHSALTKCFGSSR